MHCTILVYWYKYISQVSGERLQDHWSSGLFFVFVLVFFFFYFYCFFFCCCCFYFNSENNVHSIFVYTALRYECNTCLSTQAGHVCGDDKDLIDGKPTGAIRVSLGYMSTLQDVNTCLQFLVDCFLENPHKPVFVEKILKNQSISTGNDNIVNQQTNVKIEKNYSLKKPVSGNEQIESSTRLSVGANPGVKVDRDTRDYVGTSHKKETVQILPEHQNKRVATLDEKVTLDASSIDTVKPIKDQLYTNIVDDQMFDTVSNQGRILTDIFVYPVKSCAAFKVSVV